MIKSNINGISNLIKQNHKFCIKCELCKPLDEFGIFNRNKDKRQPYCKPCKRIHDLDFYYKNHKRIREKRKHQRKPISQQPEYVQLRKRLRDRLRRALLKQYRKSSATELLGCTLPEFKNYLESKFVFGMNWDNFGSWHLDHILPLASFNLMQKEQLQKACHYTNFQPLWKKDNLAKGAKIINFPIQNFSGLQK